MIFKYGCFMMAIGFATGLLGLGTISTITAGAGAAFIIASICLLIGKFMP